MQSLSASRIWMMSPIAISSAMRTDCSHERNSMFRWPGLGSINRGFYLRNLRFLTDFCCRYYVIFTWRDLGGYNLKLKFDNVFSRSLVSKRSFGITRSFKKFVDCMRMSNFVFGFDPDYWSGNDSDKMKVLRKAISENFKKDIKKRRFVFGNINQVLKDVFSNCFLLKSTIICFSA